MLNQFLMHPNEEFHVRGLVRILDEEINAVRRELHNLQSAGFLESKKKGNRLYYGVIPSNRFILELTHLLYKNREDVEIIHKLLLKVPEIQMALLTAGYLSARKPSEYDIDMLILGEVDVKELTAVLKEIEEKIKRELRVTALAQKDLEFHHKKRDDFLLNILREDKIFLIGSDKDLN